MEPDSLLVRGLVDNPSGGLSPALDRSTTFERAPGGGSPYGRGNAPVTAEAEALLSALEDAEATLFASGMTAWTCLCLTVLGQGKALVIPTSGYYEVELLGSEVLGRFGVELRRYDLRDAEGFRRACEGAALAIIETPSNPTLASPTSPPGGGRSRGRRTALLRQHVRDAAPAATARPRRRPRLAERHQVPRRPLRRACGLITTRDSALRERLVWVRRTIGGVLAPDPAWLLLRGLRTLHVRLPRAVATASELARRLAAHPAVTAVHYPGLPDHPEYELAQRQMPSGAGGVLAFELADGTAAGRCEEAVRLVRNATSLGGVETLIERRARIEPDGRVPEGLLRLAVGLEDADDLWADLAQAIESSQASAAASARTSAASSPIS